MHIVSGDAQGFCRDLAENSQRTLARLHRARKERRGAVLVDLHHRGAGVGRDREAYRIPHAGDAAPAPFHERASFQPKRSAALSSDSLSTTLCKTWPVGLTEPSSKALRSRMSSGSMFNAAAMSSMCDS